MRNLNSHIYNKPFYGCENNLVHVCLVFSKLRQDSSLRLNSDSKWPSLSGDWHVSTDWWHANRSCRQVSSWPCLAIT